MTQPVLPTEASQSTHHNAPHTRDDHRGRSRRSRRGFVLGLVLGALAMGAVGAIGGARLPLAEAALRAAGSHHPRLSAEEMRNHAEFFASFLLHRLEASEDQKARFLSVVDTTVDQAQPLIEQHRANRQALASVLARPTVDRAEIERLRVREAALADQLSRTLAAAIADGAEVLTAEQRVALVEHLHRFPH